MKPPEWVHAEQDFGHYLSATGKAPRTVQTYLSNLEMFWRFCCRYEISPLEADQRMVRTWITERLEQVSSNRVHNDLAALKHFYKWTACDHLRDDNPTTGARVKRAKLLPTKPLTGPEIAELVKAARDERERLVVLVLANTGLRISEMASLCAEQIDWQCGEIRIVGKGEKERRLAPPREIIDRLHAYCGMFPAGPIWLNKYTSQQLTANSLRRLIYEIAARAGIPDVHPHRLRSSFATQYIEQFADVQALQGVMGHESIETTSRYSEWTREKRGLRQMRSLDFGVRLTGSVLSARGETRMAGDRVDSGT